MFAKIEVGFRGQERGQAADGLARLRTETNALHAKAQYLQWNVKWPPKLKALLGERCRDLSLAADVIGGRLYSLGAAPEGTRRVFGCQDSEDGLGFEAAVDELVRDHEAIIGLVERRLPLMTAANDEMSALLLRERLAAHEEAAARLRAMKPVKVERTEFSLS